MSCDRRSWKQENAKATLENVARVFPDVDQTDQQVLCLLEEIGEVTGELRRYLGWARRDGNIDSLATELADVQITAYVVAEVFEFDLEAELANMGDGYFFSWAGCIRGLFHNGYLVSLHRPNHLADIIRITNVMARRLDIDLDQVIADKWKVIFERGWKEEH